MPDLEAANNRKGKNFNLRDILPPYMISHHTKPHRQEGQDDVFGDNFLSSGNYLLLPGNQEKAYLDQFPGHNKFFWANNTSDSVHKNTFPAVLNNAISLVTTGVSQALMLPSSLLSHDI
ncbi:Cdc42 effector protein 3 [Plecturocebus cupreus]